MANVSVQGREAARAARAQSQTSGSPQWHNDLGSLAFVLPFLIIYLLFLIWPVLLGLRMSFFNWSLVGTGINQFLGFGNYAEVLKDQAFWSALWHTLIFTLLTTPLLIVLSFLLAQAVNQLKHGQALFRLAFFAPYVLPVSVVVLIWNWIYQPGFGLINGTLVTIGLREVNWLADPHIAMFSVVILTIWWTLGFNFVLYLAGLQQISPELFEAGSMDGASGLQLVRWITIPLLNRTTILVIALQVISSLQVFAQIYLLTVGGPNFATRSVVQYIYESGFTSFRVGFASAMSYIFFLLILLVTVGQFWLLRRRGE